MSGAEYQIAEDAGTYYVELYGVVSGILLDQYIQIIKTVELFTQKSCRQRLVSCRCSKRNAFSRSSEE